MEFKAICTGEVVPLEKVNDPVFSDRMMGDGLAFRPSSDKIHSPIDGTILFLYPSGHALGIQDAEGVEILIHFGLSSFNVPEGIIKPFIKVGDAVKAGDLLIHVDLEYFKSKNIDTITPVVFTSGESVSLLKENESVTLGEDNLIRLIKHGKEK